MFTRILNAMIEGRQRVADREIARLLQREWPQETQEYIEENIVRSKRA
jgi:hypothetical protein